MMNKPHVYKDLIIAWANGAQIQTKRREATDWNDVASPGWYTHLEYRIKPEPKPDLKIYCKARWNEPAQRWLPGLSRSFEDNLMLTFDGETGKLKAAEVL